MEVKIVKLINGDDVVCTVPEQDIKSKWMKIEKPLEIAIFIIVIFYL